MGGEEPVRCEVPYFPVVAIGIGAAWLTGVIAALVYGDGRALFLMCGLLVLTIGISVRQSRYAVRAVEFTRSEVRMERRVGVRTMPVTALSRVSVRHEGETLDGYRETWLDLEWRAGSDSFTCGHEPELAGALRRRLPARVSVDERWEELQEPSTG